MINRLFVAFRQFGFGNQRTVPSLDGLRAISIAFVLFCHLCGTRHFPGKISFFTLRFGEFGVRVFFVISGYLITSILLAELWSKGTISLARFYFRRTLRLFPARYFFILVVAILAMKEFVTLEPWDLTHAITYTMNFHDARAWSLGHLWSLAVEEHFYLLWPGLLAWVGARRSKNLAARLALAVALWRMVQSQFAASVFALIPAHFRTDVRLDALLWGCVVAFILDNADARARLAKQLQFGVWFAMAGLLGLCIVYYSEITSVMVAVLIPMLLAGTTLHPRWALSRALDWAPVAWIGRISYSLYLWQALFLYPGWEHPAHWWQQWPANLPVTVAVAALSYYVIEKPLQRVGRKLASQSLSQSRDASSGLKQSALAALK